MIGAVRTVLVCQVCSFRVVTDNKTEAERAAENHLKSEPAHVLHSSVVIEYRNFGY